MMDWSYKKKGLLIGIFLWIFLHLIWIFLKVFPYATFIELFKMGVIGIFSEGGIVTGILSLAFCYIVGWTIDAIKNDTSATNKGLLLGLVVSIFSLAFMFFEGYFNIDSRGPYLPHMFDNFIVNSGYLWMSVPIILFTLIGFIIDLLKRTNKEIVPSIVSAIVILAIIFGAYGIGSFFYSNNPSKCQFYSDKDSCYSAVALNLVNQGELQLSLCEKIQDDTLKFKCYIWLAFWNKDAQVCEKIPSLSKKDVCIANVAMAQNDTSICDKTRKEFKEECLKFVSEPGYSYI